jgi:hypothetical protein
MNEYQVIAGAGGGEPMTTISTRPVVTPQRVSIDMEDERIQEVVSRLQRVILVEHPDAEFVSYIGTSPLGVYVEVYTTNDAFLGILKLIDDKLGNLHIAAGVDICVLPKRKVQAQAA